MDDLLKTLSKIVGTRLTEINLACEMMMFHFDNFALHAQCLTRIVKNNDILVTTLDFQSWDGENGDNNDEWHNLKKFKQDIIGGKVGSIDISPLNDLTVYLDNGVTIQIYIQNSYAHFDDEHEQYRFFEVGPDAETEKQANARRHLVVYNKHVAVE